jgi:conjugal transfer pilin signal peptidase TrbI
MKLISFKFIKNLNKKQWLIVITGSFLCSIFFMFLGSQFAKKFGFIAFNVSGSLPDTAYKINPRIDKFQRGELLAYQLDKDQFLHSSRIIKIIYGVAGDRVIVKGQDVYVNENFIATAKKSSVQGYPLTITQERTIPKGCFFVATPHKDSYDSRYETSGLVCEDRIIGRATVLF